MRTAAIVLLALAAAAPAAGQGQCEDAFGVTIEPGTLSLRHTGAEYNCCFDEVRYTVEQTAAQILVSETEIAGEPCDCICCYELSAAFEDLAPGTYELVVTWQQGGAGQGEWRQMVEIPGTAAGPAAVGPVLQSECGATRAEPDRSWSAIKGTYR